jgi:shikimate kinase
MRASMIQLIGPGGAGKTTTGAALSGRLGARFVDLDAEFVSRHGDISPYLDEHGYAAYASATSVSSDVSMATLTVRTSWRCRPDS